MRPSRERAHEVTRLVLGSFLEYVAGLRALTARAPVRFAEQDWHGAQHDSVERFAVYRRAVDHALLAVRDMLREDVTDRALWKAVRQPYADEVRGRADRELALTFYNSVVRRALGTVGVEPALEFLELDMPAPVHDPANGVTVTLADEGGLEALLRAVLLHLETLAPWADLAGDAARARHAIEARLPGRTVRALEIVPALFFRNKGAYVVGRLRTDAGWDPLLLALLNHDGRVALDAVLLGEDDASTVFSFTRSYFFVEAARPRPLVAFLHALLPRKPLAELYNAIGYDRHGKTEQYRALQRHIGSSAEQFVIAPGIRGMVMLVFTMPSFDVVFKIIRDRFDYPKTASREEVIQKYQLVSEHDRAGRLVDAQEFRDLEFDRARFDEALLAELETGARESADVGAERVRLMHLYTERKLVPLDIYLRRASAEMARIAILDYGQAVRDLAATNIFPGDLLLKNFGVTRLGRVVFYDYDELCLVTECNFRDIPAPRYDDEETAGEAWYYVGERDIFPEEILNFLGLTKELREVFLSAHADLLTSAFWNRMKDEHQAGHVLDLFPYRPERRLRTP